jgi:hypothetical protein
MNIKEAKEQIKNAMSAYFTRDEFGNYMIPIERQRPIFLMGAPGIGKTAIMEQVAQELGVALVSYSMTHHTRQSALGLPFIIRKDYGGVEYDISEYTMSEIIASVYESMEKTGLKQGILFLDEINCVSETLAPSMLQFLQFKIFGRHRVPDGWIVVTAGNPPEYNKSVREFDVVTLDRLKRMDIEPDFEAWKDYAYRIGVHPAIMTYLEIKKGDFYLVETTVDGKRFVTARGWVDLSQMIQLYERHGFPVNEKLVIQYLQEEKIAKNFAIYYDLFNKYKADYQVDTILAGKANDEIKTRARSAKFDERISLLGLLLDSVSLEMREVVEKERALTELMKELQIALGKMMVKGANPISIMEKQIDALQKKVTTGRQNNTLSPEAIRSGNIVIDRLQKQKEILLNSREDLDGKYAYQLLKKDFDGQSSELAKDAKKAGSSLSNVFEFVEEVFGEGQEVLILVTELTSNTQTARFISRFGSDAYFRHNKELLFYERQKELILEIENLNLTERN